MNRKRGGTPYIYVSGALSGLGALEFERVTAIYDLIADCAGEAGVVAYRPHRSRTAPGRLIKPSTVWSTDFRRVTQADLLVAYVGLPSFGVGAEIEMARTAGVPVILVCETDRVARLSRLVLGSPAIRDVIPFADHGTLRTRLVPAIRMQRGSRQIREPRSKLSRLADEVIASAKRKSSRGQVLRTQPTNTTLNRVG